MSRSNDGFSLVETVVSLSLFCLVFTMVFALLSAQKRLWMEQESQRDEFRTLTAAMGWLTRDLQEAGYQGIAGPIHSLEDDAISYELSRNEEVPASFSREYCRLITVYLKEGRLMYRIQRWDPASSTWRRGSTHTLASGLERIRFRGLDTTGAASCSPDDVAAVEIFLSGRRVGTLRTTVTLRNYASSGRSQG